MTRSSGNWTLDLWHGEGIQRADGVDRVDNLNRARQEMRDTGSADLFDAIADTPAIPRRPEHARCYRPTDIEPAAVKYFAWQCSRCDCASTTPLLAEIDSGICHWCHDDELAARGELRYAFLQRGLTDER